MYKTCCKVGIALAVLLMASCSEPPTTESTSTNKAESSGPAKPVLGKKAFFEMYKSAYSWSNDLLPLKLESKDLPGLKNDAGAAGLWSATFGSPRKHQAVVISYAVAAHPPDIYQGINVGRPVPWGGPSRDVMPFQTSDLGVDSDAVYKAALAQAEPWLKKHPDKQASFLLGNNSTRFSAPVWYVIWGDTKSGYSIFINARTGEVAKPGK